MGEATERVRRDAAAGALPDDGRPLRDGGTGARAYAEAVAVYLGLGVSKLADAQTSLCRWKTTMDQSIATFGRQALPMVWDYSEANVFGGMAGDPLVSINNMMRVVDQLPASVDAHAKQADAQRRIATAVEVVSTDPPYYDNIGYADLSDFFYVWLRHAYQIALFATFYNWCRKHLTLETTPAVAAGLTDVVYDVDWLVGLIEDRDWQPGPRGPYKKRLRHPSQPAPDTPDESPTDCAAVEEEDQEEYIVYI